MPERNSTLTEPSEDWTRPLVERQLQLLGDLAEIGLEMARAVERRVKAAGPEVDLNRLSMAYARAARAVRMTIALQSRLITELKAREQARAEKHAEAEIEDDNARFELEQDRKVRVARILRRVIGSVDGDAETLERLGAEAADWLEDDDLCGDVLSRPLGEIIADICRDLGLSPDWPRLAEEAWARSEMASGAAGSPFTSPIAAAMAGAEDRERRP